MNTSSWIRRNTRCALALGRMGGYAYANLSFNHSASQLNGPNGNSLPGITGTYSFWVDVNIFYYVAKHKFLGGYFILYVALTYTNGELLANITGAPPVAQRGES